MHGNHEQEDATLLLAFLAGTLGPQEATRPADIPEAPIALEFREGDPSLEARGPSRVVPYRVLSSGTLYLYVLSEELDPFLRAEGAAGALLGEDDNGGGGNGPFLALTVEEGAEIRITVAGVSPAARGRASLTIREAPETADTLAAAEAARKGFKEVEDLRAKRDLVAARTRLDLALEALVSTHGAEGSRAVDGALWDLGRAAYDSACLPTALRALTFVGAFRERFLPPYHFDLQRVRVILANTMYPLGDSQGARALQEEVLEVFSRTLPDDHPHLQLARTNLAATTYVLGDLEGARALQEKVLEIRLRTLPDDHPHLQLARTNLALTIRDLGDARGARALQEKVLEVLSRTLPDDHLELQRARGNLGSTLERLGDLRGARALQEKVLEVLPRTLPDDHPELQSARTNLAGTLTALGDLDLARALQEKVLEVRSRTLPDDHPLLQLARGNVASTLVLLGESKGARALQEKVLEVCSRTLPDDHPELQRARGNLAATLHDFGELHRARALEEKVLEVRSRTLPDDHPYVQTARANLAGTIGALGDLEGARALQEKVLEVRSRTLPDDHTDLQAARGNLAATIHDLGDLRGALALHEKVLEVRSRTLPDDHPLLQGARGNLANTMRALGDFDGARGIEENVLEVFSRTLSDDHPSLQLARENLATTILLLGDLEGARALQEKVLEVYSRTRPDEHPDLQRARGQFAVTLRRLGDLEGARALQEEVLEVHSRALPNDHPDLQRARLNLAVTLARLGESQSARRILRSFAQGSSRVIRASALSLSNREVEAVAGMAQGYASVVLSLTGGAGSPLPPEDIRPEAFALVESIRGAGATARRVLRLARSQPNAGGLRREIEESSAEVARISLAGGAPEALHEAVRRKEKAERDLREALGSSPAAAALLEEVSHDRIARALGPEEAAVGYWRYDRWEPDPGNPSADRSDPRFLAFVLRKGEPLRRIELAGAEEIERAVQRWRMAIGAPVRGSRGVGRIAGSRVPVLEREEGVALRKALLDPLRPALGNARRLIVALDDALHAVPLETLPEGDGVIGDRLEISYRTTLWEIAVPAEGPLRDPLLLALGGIDYEAGPESRPAGGEVPADSGVASRAPAGAPGEAVRAGNWERRFPPLAATGEEAEEIAALFRRTYPASAPPRVLAESAATKEALRALSARARFLHLATHAYYAPESVPSTRDDRPLELRLGLGRFASHEERVRGFAPMVLCGIALAGANGPEDMYGRLPGVMTAEEVATLDLSGCELAVLSACDANVGLRRAGQGIASLQSAVHAAGARSAITSLWRIPDTATRELMVDFYRGIWIEGKSKSRALWDAKRKLRDRRDGMGNPAHATWEWAGLVLTGDP